MSSTKPVARRSLSASLCTATVSLRASLMLCSSRSCRRLAWAALIVIAMMKIPVQGAAGSAACSADAVYQQQLRQVGTCCYWGTCSKYPRGVLRDIPEGCAASGCTATEWRQAQAAACGLGQAVHAVLCVSRR